MEEQNCYFSKISVIVNDEGHENDLLWVSADCVFHWKFIFWLDVFVKIKEIQQYFHLWYYTDPHLFVYSQPVFVVTRVFINSTFLIINRHVRYKVGIRLSLHQSAFPVILTVNPSLYSSLLLQQVPTSIQSILKVTLGNSSMTNL